MCDQQTMGQGDHLKWSALEVQKSLVLVKTKQQKKQPKKSVCMGGRVLNTEELNQPGLHVNCPATPMIQANGICLK